MLPQESDKVSNLSAWRICGSCSNYSLGGRNQLNSPYPFRQTAQAQSWHGSNAQALRNHGQECSVIVAVDLNASLKKTLLACALLGLVCHGLYNIFYSLAVTLAGVSVSAVLLNIAPVFTLLFSALLFGEKLVWSKFLAIALNVTGCVLTATNGQFDIRLLSLTGILCGVGAGLCYGLTAIFGRLAAGKADSFIISMYSYLFAALFLTLWSRPWRGVVTLNSGILLWGFLYALIPTSIAYILYYRGLQAITESSKVPVIASVEAVVATGIGVALYQEQLGICSILGVALVLVSIAVMNAVPKTKKPA